MTNKMLIWETRIVSMIAEKLDCSSSDAQAIIMAKTKDNPNWLLEKFMVGTSAIGVVTELTEVN